MFTQRRFYGVTKEKTCCLDKDNISNNVTTKDLSYVSDHIISTESNIQTTVHYVNQTSDHMPLTGIIEIWNVL